jgi:3,5-epimerase/4-reductase
MKVLIFGAGWLGSRFLDSFDDSVLCCNKVHTLHEVISELVMYEPEVVINCVGKTGRPNIDWCEENKFDTEYNNVIVPMLINQACSTLGIKMVHIGTGCIYEGGPFTEEDTPNCLESWYSKTKYLAERALAEHNVLQLRIRMPIDVVPHERNFLTKILSYDKLINCLNSVTVVDDLLDVAKTLIEIDAKGIFNVTSFDISHSELLSYYNQYTSGKKKWKQISVDELHYLTKAKRSNCILNTDKLRGVGLTPKYTPQEIVKEYVEHEKLEAVL